MKRNTMDLWLQECRNCKLICPKIAEPPAGIDSVIAQAEYTNLAQDTNAPNLVRKFRTWAYLANKTHLEEESAFAHLHAAWAADDAKREDFAESERRAAIVGLSELREKDMFYPEQPGAADAVLADLWRRIGEWQEAVHEATRGASIANDDTIKKLCAFQIVLANQHDAGVHTLAELQPEKSHDSAGKRS